MTTYRAAFVASQGIIQTIRFMRFIAEVLDGFIVQQTVDRLGIGFAIRLVHLTAKFDPPFGHGNRVVNIADNGHKSDQGIGPAKIDQQIHTHHRDGEKGGN